MYPEISSLRIFATCKSPKQNSTLIEYRYRINMDVVKKDIFFAIIIILKQLDFQATKTKCKKAYLTIKGEESKYKVIMRLLLFLNREYYTAHRVPTL